MDDLPEEISASGYERVVLTGRFDPAAVEGVWVGGVRALEPTPTDGGLEVLVQGGPAGPAGVTLRIDGADHAFEGAVTYAEGAASSVFAMGGSVAMGAQSGVAYGRGILVSPSWLVARQLGAWMPLPLLDDALFTPMDASLVGAPPECALPRYQEWIVDEFIDALAFLEDPEIERPDFTRGRLDPDAPIGMATAPGTSLDEMVEGFGGDVIYEFFGHLIYDPWGDLYDEAPPQLALAEASGAELILLPDFLGNDVVDSVTGEALDPSLTATAEDLAPWLDELLARLGALDAQVFLGEAPPPTTLPIAAQAAAPEGRERAAVYAEIEAKVQDINDALHAGAAGYDNLHVVPVYDTITTYADEGALVDDELLGPWKFGGMVSLDGVHFSDTGYALFAQLFLDAIGAELGLDVAPLDAAATLAGDPYSPAALDAALDLGACE